jgi:hypothetical protein
MRAERKLALPPRLNGQRFTASAQQQIVRRIVLNAATTIFNDTGALELARIVVTILSGVGAEPIKFGKLQEWRGESRRRTKLAIDLAEREGWIVNSGSGSKLARDGRKILNRRR